MFSDVDVNSELSNKLGENYTPTSIIYDISYVN